MIDLSKFAEQIQKSVEIVESIKKAKVQATGFIGEFVFDEIAKGCLNENYEVISDVVLKFNNGTTQIDQIIVSIFGIFIVEIKTYKGWIFGDRQNARWTQTLYNTKNTFQNPLRQNYKHIKALQNILGFSDDKFISLIVFSGEAKFKTEMPDNVVRGGEDYINYILEYQDVILRKNEVENAVEKILDNRLSNADHQAYMEKVKGQYKKSDRNNPPPCPRCAKKMVLRTSKKGYYKGRQFWGCGDYPNCRAIVNIENDKECVEDQIIKFEKAFNMFLNKRNITHKD